jgi:hypothetical protein
MRKNISCFISSMLAGCLMFSVALFGYSKNESIVTAYYNSREDALTAIKKILPEIRKGDHPAVRYQTTFNSCRLLRLKITDVKVLELNVVGAGEADAVPRFQGRVDYYLEGCSRR